MGTFHCKNIVNVDYVDIKICLNGFYYGVVVKNKPTICGSRLV